MISLFAVKGLIHVSKKRTTCLFHTSTTVCRASISSSGPVLRVNEIDGALEAHLAPFKPFRIEFQATRLKASHTERVVKAVSACDLVFDLTAGLGRDAVILAAAGRRVVMIERNLLLFQLLQDGIRRLHVDVPSIAQRVCLLQADATLLSSTDLMQQAFSHFNITHTDHKPMTINVYLDPMYPTPPGDRRAKSRKETQILQALTEEADKDSDSDDSGSKSKLEMEEGLLFQAACGLANGRIVVKRGLRDPPLRVPLISNSAIKHFDSKDYLKPHSAVEGSTQRFDLYFMDRLLDYQQQQGIS